MIIIVNTLLYSSFLLCKQNPNKYIITFFLFLLFVAFLLFLGPSRPPPPKNKNGKNDNKKKKKNNTSVAPFNVREWENEAHEGNSFSLRVDGPYGSAAEEVSDFKHIMLVGAGIGVTPFASIIRNLVLKSESQERGSSRSKKKSTMIVHFYWLCRNKEEFLSFRDLMKVQIADRKTVHFNLYLSGKKDFFFFLRNKLFFFFF